jgi:RNA polymerase sigma factor (sigma-70 family)
MTADAASAAGQPDPARPRAAMAHPPRQHRRGGHAGCGPGTPTRTDPDHGCGNPVVTDLVTRARNGDNRAWDALVDRYAPLIWSICRRHGLAGADADDVGQSVWLRLVDQLDKLRDPAALPGWLATTTRRECLRVLHAMRRPQTARYDLKTEILPTGQPGTAEQELLAAERHAALHEAFLTLPPRGQQLIALLVQDPPVPYAEISAKLGIPVGSIGPSRRRYLDKLRRHPAIAALITPAEVWSGD